MRRPLKYRNRIVKDRDGTVFHSQRELTRWRELCLLQAAGEISDLERQVPIELKGMMGKICYDNKRAAKIVVDFRYMRGGELVLEDAKGHETQVSKLKRAIARAMGIEVELVR